MLKSLPVENIVINGDLSSKISTGKTHTAHSKKDFKQTLESLQAQVKQPERKVENKPQEIQNKKEVAHKKTEKHKDPKKKENADTAPIAEGNNKTVQQNNTQKKEKAKGEKETISKNEKLTAPDVNSKTVKFKIIKTNQPNWKIALKTKEVKISKNTVILNKPKTTQSHTINRDKLITGIHEKKVSQTHSKRIIEETTDKTPKSAKDTGKNTENIKRKPPTDKLETIKPKTSSQKTEENKIENLKHIKETAEKKAEKPKVETAKPNLSEDREQKPTIKTETEPSALKQFTVRDGERVERKHNPANQIKKPKKVEIEKKSAKVKPQDHDIEAKISENRKPDKTHKQEPKLDNINRTDGKEKPNTAIGVEKKEKTKENKAPDLKTQIDKQQNRKTTLPNNVTHTETQKNNHNTKKEKDATIKKADKTMSVSDEKPKTEESTKTVKFALQNEKTEATDTGKKIQQATKDGQHQKQADNNTIKPAHLHLEKQQTAQTTQINTVNDTTNIKQQESIQNSYPMDKIIEHIERIQHLKPPFNNTIIVKLNPPHIGIMEIRVRMERDKTISAFITSHDKDVVKIVSTHTDQLKSYLASQGIKVTHIDVQNSFAEHGSFGNNANSSNANTQGQMQQGGYAQPERNRSAEFEFKQTAPRVLRRNSGVDITA